MIDIALLALSIATGAVLLHSFVQLLLGLSAAWRPDVVRLADAAIAAHRYAFEVRAGMHRPIPKEKPVSPERKALNTWLAANSEGEAADGHIIGMWEAVHGERPAARGKVGEYTNILLNLGVPLAATPTMTLGG